MEVRRWLEDGNFVTQQGPDDNDLEATSNRRGSGEGQRGGGVDEGYGSKGGPMGRI